MIKNSMFKHLRDKWEIRAAVKKENDSDRLMEILLNTGNPEYAKETESKLLKNFSSALVVNSIIKCSTDWAKKFGFPEFVLDLISGLTRIPMETITTALNTSGLEIIAARILVRLVDSGQSKELRTQAEEVLKETSTHSASAVRLAVAQSKNTSKSQNVEYILLDLSFDKDASTRETAINGLIGKINGKFNIEFLKLMIIKDALKSNTELIKEGAAQILVTVAENYPELSNDFEKLFINMTEEKSDVIIIKGLSGLSLTKTISALKRLYIIANNNNKLRREAAFAIVNHIDPELSGNFIIQALDSQVLELILEIFNAINRVVSENNNNKYNLYKGSQYSKNLIVESKNFKDILGEILQRITKFTSSDDPILSKEAKLTFSALSEFIKLQKQHEEKQVKSTPMGGFVETLDDIRDKTVLLNLLLVLHKELK